MRVCFFEHYFHGNLWKSSLRIVSNDRDDNNVVCIDLASDEQIVCLTCSADAKKRAFSFVVMRERERERESLFWSCSQQRPSQGRDSTSMENITINKAASSSDKEKRHREPFFLVSEIMERRQLCHEEVKQ